MLKRIVLWTGAAVLSMGMSISAYAATVQKLEVTITAPEAVEGGFQEPEITVPQSAPYSISEVTWKTDVEKWRPGSQQQVDVMLELEDGVEYRGHANEKNWSIRGAKFVRSKRDEDRYVQVTLNYGPPKILLGTPEKVGWSQDAVGTAKWSQVKNAHAYEVKVYVDDELKKTVRVDEPLADLSSEVSAVRDIYYEVRAVAKDSKESAYLVASQWASSRDSEYYYSDELGSTDGKWVNQNGMRYQRVDGSFSTNGWEMIVGTWYYFDENGVRTTGWRQIQNKWYYLDQDGKMQTGWLLLDSQWYYLHGDGSMAVGWQQAAPGKWYYLYDNGMMAKNTQIGSYVVDGSGLWIQ